ncbi:MAG: hypothetical protein ACOYOK_00920 [Pseudobdellovibrionaceae bacterium]
MKNKLFLRVAVGVLPQIVSMSVYAQTLDNEVDGELDQVYNRPASVATQPSSSAASVGGIRSSGTVSGQPIYILNQATPTSSASANTQTQQAQVQKQPITMIEASPLTESNAEKLRKARQEAELQTEQKIVEKLEYSRMTDEQRRANVLFGDKFNQLNQSNQIQAENVTVQAQQPVIQAPVQVVPQSVVVAPAVQQVEDSIPEENTRDVVREEIRSALDAEKAVKETPTATRYFSGLVGIGDYPEVSNVKGNYAMGAAFGNKYDDSLIVEGAFIFSNYSVTQTDYFRNYIPETVNVDQYSGALALKYQFLSGLVRPVLGGLAQYSYRKFNWENYYGYNSTYGGDTATSHAIDLGIVTGIDLEFNPKFSLGLDYRYMFNMSSRVDTNRNGYFLTDSQYTGTPIEKLQYYIISLAAKVSF